MNRRCYRIVFNEKRGTMMVVAEKRGIGKGAATSAVAPIQKNVDIPEPSMQLSAIALAILAITGALFLLPSTANAQIVADPAAPANQRPTIINTGNGLPQVNIQTPSAAGVSRNTYSQFDVQKQGAILNNSRTDVQTQLGGWIQGNSNLAKGGARIILNEINSSNPSYLRGYVEVAGGRAQVIIANPSGVTCDGCGFINANRATLTTGEAIMNNGNLDGYRVSRGVVTVQGDGLNARDTDYTDIIARAAQINAGIWGQTLKVTAGANQVDAANNVVQEIPLAMQDAVPSFGIDVAQLGGMYANKIILIGTEAGVGVRNAGEIGAAAGDVIVRSDGQLINSNSIQSTGDIHLAVANSIDNSAGTISAGRSLQISDQAVAKALQIKNTGGTLFAANQLDIDSAGLTGDGNILSDGGLTLKLADGFINTGVVQAGGLLDMEMDDVLVNRGQLRAGDIFDLHAMNIDNRSDGTITARYLDLKAADTFSNRGLIDAEDTLIDAHIVDNVGTGRVYGDHIAIHTEALRNEAESVGGIVSAATIAARGRLDIAAETIANREHATLFSLGDMAVGGSLDADYQAIGQAGTVDNNSATIEATGALDLTAKLINNTNEHFNTEEVEVSRQQITEYQTAGSPNRYRPDEIRIEHGEVDYLVTPTGSDYKFHRYDYTRVTSETGIKESDPAKILSGGAMHIAADKLFNDKSIVMAGGALIGDITELVNTEAAGQRVVSDSGTASYFYDIEKRGRDQQGLIVADYQPAAFVQKISLTPTVYTQNTKGAGSGTKIDTRDTEHMNTTILLPDSSMFEINADPEFNYLVQSDPNFTDHRIWLSSDYLLQQMGADPVSVHKRLGDGFYEQKLIREQIGELTGRRFLDGYADDEVQYRTLLDSGATYAKKLNLRVGVALSAEQMSQLTSDVVLLIEKDVILPNGEINKVLVPQLYAKVRDGDINGAGALLSGDTVDLKIQGDVVNSGTISGRTHLALDADSIKNLGGRISAADVSLQAANDIDNLGGVIDAVNKLDVAAGRDLNIVSTTHTSHSEQGSRTNIDGIASLSVGNPGATLIATAGRDVNIQAGQVVNGAIGGNTTIAAGGDLNLGTVTESNAQSISWSADNDRKESANRDFGSMIAAAGDVSLLAGRNIEAKAAEVTSEFGAIAAVAGNDINLGSGKSGVSVDERHQTEGSSGWFSSKTTKTRDQVEQTQALGSTFSGNSVSLLSGNDINVSGSNIVATADMALVAKHDINIAAAANTNDETHLRDEQTSGLSSGGGVGISIGTQEQKNTDRQTAISSSISSIGSTNGNVNIAAGNDYRQTGSQLLAPEGDINIAAKKVDIVAATDVEFDTQDTEFKKSGVSISITNPILAAAQSVRQMKTASTKTKDSRMQGLAGSAAALTVANTADAVAASAAAAGGVDLAVSIGASKNETRSEQRGASAQGSRVAAGGNITITAGGAGKHSDLTIQGSDIAAGKNINLKADDEINILAAENTNEQHTSNKGISGSIGFSVGTSGYMVNASASGSRGHGDGTDMSHRNSHVDAGKKLTITSGTDTNIIGAVASGKQVTMEVGTSGAGNLNVASLQDSSDYKSIQQSLGGSVSVGVGKMSGSISAAQSKVNGKYVSVNEQSGIVAGNGGFDIKVHGNTHLEGSKIASTDLAAKKGKNSLSTETLTQGDIANHSDYKASSFSLSVGGGYSSAGSAMNGAGIGFGNADGSDGSTTKTGISKAKIVIADKTGQQARTGKTAEQVIAAIDTNVSSAKDTSGKLTKGWNGQQLQEEVDAQAQITAAFGKESSKNIGTYATNKENDLRRQASIAEKNDPALARQLNDEANMWAEGGDYRIALHAAAGAMTGGINGAAGAMASAEAMPQIAKVIDELDLPNTVKQGLAQVTAAAIGAVVGGATDVAASLNVEANNRQLHTSETEMIKKNAVRFAAELYGTNAPSDAQISGALSLLSNTAQHLLDNNIGYTVPYSEKARAFLQTLQMEYASISPNLSIGDGQYLFYATAEQRSDSSLNSGSLDKEIAAIIVKTPIKSIDISKTVDHKRDHRTNLPLDDQGRYSEQAYVNGDMYQPKYFPCADIRCQDHNLDMSDAGTQAYVKAIDLNIVKNIGNATDAAIVLNPVGAVGIVGGAVGSSVALAYGIHEDSIGEAITAEALQYGSIQYMKRVYKLTEAMAVRAVAHIDLAGGWDAFVERTQHYLSGDKRK
jgi:filamentous hemagglutinin